MLTIPGTHPNTLVEFRRGTHGTIQRREIPAEPADSLRPWRDLSRLETIFYLNRGGVVGLWLEDLRRQGFIQTRQKCRRALINFIHYMSGQSQTSDPNSPCYKQAYASQNFRMAYRGTSFRRDSSSCRVVSRC